MTFSSKIKKEISTTECTRAEYLSELSGVIRTSAEIKIYNIKIQTENKFVANRIFGLFKILYDINLNITLRKNYNFKKNEIYVLELKRDTLKVLRDLGIVNDKNQLLRIPSESLLSDDELTRAYLRGVFMVSGSLNDPKTSRYHLEFLINDTEYANFLNNLLKANNLNSKILHRKKGYMIYVKEAEKISDFLRLIRAYNGVMYYEEIRVYREKINMTNRLNNCEQANIERTIETSSKLVKQINYIKEKGMFDLLDEKLQESAEYRLRYPESSLLELSKIMSLETNTNISKSCLNHRFRKIKEFADKVMKD
ncbi:MAG: DNA-binding protein WhiA [Bacilli bacterium]|nr:DNA-binding protein WhiA [Bacilli bacterium]